MSKMTTRRFGLFLVMLAGILANFALAAELPAFKEKLATRATIDEVRAGGFVLYMRHGNTDTSRPDRVPQVDLGDCSTQRPLNEEGRHVAARVGEAIRKARIPVGEIIVSPMCRTRETAQLAFGAKFSIDNGLMYTSNLTSREKSATLEATRARLSMPLAAGVNRVLVAHAPNLMDLMGYFIKHEATVAIFRPLGENKFEYVASIPPTLWPELLK